MASETAAVTGAPYKIIKSGDKTLAHDLEANGYADIIGAAA